VNGCNPPVIPDHHHHGEFSRAAVVSPAAGTEWLRRGIETCILVRYRAGNRWSRVGLSTVVQNVSGIVTKLDQDRPATQSVGQCRAN
jgi:hypothetical protein